MCETLALKHQVEVYFKADTFASFQAIKIE